MNSDDLICLQAYNNGDTVLFRSNRNFIDTLIITNVHTGTVPACDVPQNRSEYGSYIHDFLYDKAKAVGVEGALWNTSQDVIDADFFLARYNYLNMMNPQTPIIDRGRSALTAPVFFLLQVISHYLIS